MGQRRMQDKLKTLVGGIRHAADSIQVASREVAAGNQDLSRRTEDAASNLQQTASSMDHLTGIVMNSADSTRLASLSSPRRRPARRRVGARWSRNSSAPWGRSTPVPLA
jgi:methyl-accepting chemotaxis protein